VTSRYMLICNASPAASTETKHTDIIRAAGNTRTDEALMHETAMETEGEYIPTLLIRNYCFRTS
jgi:hypothetical protein